MSFGDTNISFSNIAYIIDGRDPGPGTAISLSSFREIMDIPSSGPISIETYFQGKTFTSFPPLTDDHNYGYIGTSTSLYNYIGKRKIQNDDDSATYSWVAVQRTTTNFQTSSNYEKSVGGAELETISYSFDTKSWASEITITFNYRDENNEEKTFSKGRNGTSSLSNYTLWNGTLSVYPNSTVTINGTDSYGDGWHGAYLTITYNGNQIARKTIPNYGSNMETILFEVGGEVSDGLGFREDFTPTNVSNLVSFETYDQGGNIVSFKNNSGNPIFLYTDIIFGGYDYDVNREHIGVEFTVSEKVVPYTYMALKKVSSKDVHIDEIPYSYYKFDAPVGGGFYGIHIYDSYTSDVFEMNYRNSSGIYVYPSYKNIGTSSRSVVEPGDSIRLTVQKNSSNNCDIVVWSRSHENSIWVKNYTYTTTDTYTSTYWSPLLGVGKFNDTDGDGEDYKIKNFQLIDQADDVKGEWAYFEFDEEVFLSKLIIRMGNINVWQRQVKIISLVASDEPDAQTSNVAVLTHFEGYPSNDTGNYDESNKEYMTFDFEKYISTVKYKKKFKYWGLIIENLKSGGRHLNIRYIQFFKKNVEENLFTSTPTIVENTKITVKDWSTQYNSSYSPSNALNTNTDIWENGNSKDGNGSWRQPYNANGYYSDSRNDRLNIISNL
jgi:hypothetical protein